MHLFALDNPLPEVRFLDFESSGLHTPSFPIEVGIARCDGSALSHLIRPAARWLSWEWSAAAEAVHGISLSTIVSLGRDPERVADFIENECSGCLVLSDNPSCDEYWLSVLYEEVDRPLPFRVASAQDFADQIWRSQGVRGSWSEARARISLSYPHTHRASDDALSLAMTVRSITED